MSVPMPASCPNRDCRHAEIKPIHCISQKVAIDDIEVRPVYSHLVTYRCLNCGHTWAVQGYSCEEFSKHTQREDFAVSGILTASRGW